MLKNQIKPLFLLALVLRWIGINHGYPFIFHPDEPTVVQSALGVRFYPNPAHFDWPHLHIYLNYFLYMVFARFRTLLEVFSLRGALPILWEEPFVFYLISRLFTAFLGALTVIPVYLAAKTLFNKRVGLFSALVFALIPFHVWHSHYILVDVPMVFWLSWGVYFAVRILKFGKISDYLLAGFFVGLSASTKYNGGLGALAIPLAYVLLRGVVRSVKPSKETFLGIRNLVLSAFAAAFGFLLGTPYALFDFDTFSRTDGPKGAFWQFTNVGKVDFVTHTKQFFETLAIQLSNDLGYVFMAIFLGLLIYLLVKKKMDKRAAFLYILAFVAIYYVSGFSKTRSHYFMICYPFVAILVGYGVHVISEKIPSTLVYKKFLLGLIFVIPLLFSVYKATLFVREDTRVILHSWLIDNVSLGSKVYYFDEKDFEIVVKSLENVSSDKLDAISDIPSELEENYTGYLILDDEESALISGNTFLRKRIEVEGDHRRGPSWVIYEF